MNVSKWFLMFYDLRLMNMLGVVSSLEVQYIKDCVHKFIAGVNSVRNPASCDIISAAMLLWDTAVCFLQAHEIGTNVCDPNIQNTT